MPDHQNYYKNMDDYFADKAQIFLHQKAGDTLVIGESLQDRVRAAHAPVEPIVPGELPKDWRLRVMGHHNRHNASLAASALLALGLTASQIQTGLESFEAVEGRLQFVGEKNGVKFYNDNNATTPEATVAALSALDENKRNIILIAGGSDKGLALENLAHAIDRTCKKVVLLDGSGTAKLQALVPGAHIAESLAVALQMALSACSEGDMVLFSPAFASFGMFQNEYERNDEFIRLVASL
jgi:UDP-N-acetylmuramoylalanine--D-glutamate ligase